VIRYDVTKEKLQGLIITESANWLQRAKEKTDHFREIGKYDEEKGIWGEVKVVYMRLQGRGKCAYCEREMEAVELGKTEQDVEHFRPKGNVKAWKAPKKLEDSGIVFAKPAAHKKGHERGYHLLPYHLFNYAAACKPCNETMKSDCFPIAGEYKLDAEDPADLVNEKAYLIYPIGDTDDDPEDLIEFYGTSPRPVAAEGFRRHRALVTIAFFELDDTGRRDNLYRDRALLIMGLFPLLQKTTQGTAAARAAAKKTVKEFLIPRLRHLNCAKSFQRLFDTDPTEANDIYDKAVQLVTSKS
jgi:hypothetical protein